MPFKGDYILELNVYAHKSLRLFLYKELQNNLLNAYDEPINIYSIVDYILHSICVVLPKISAQQQAGVEQRLKDYLGWLKSIHLPPADENPRFLC